jgi:hypothetical protein
VILTKARNEIKATLNRIKDDLSPDIVEHMDSILEELALDTYAEGYRDALESGRPRYGGEHG